MAERRMFAKTIIDSDAFLDMPLTTQALYFHLSMRADDEGFINNPKKIMRMIGASDDELRLLIAKSFIIPFDSGVCVIKHWKIHNYLRSDRFKPTVYTEEKDSLIIKDNKAYSLKPQEINDSHVGIPVGIPDGYQLDTQDRLGKDRLGKYSTGEYRKGEYEGETQIIDAEVIEPDNQDQDPPDDEHPGASTRVPHEQIRNLYNTICISYPRCNAMSDARKKAIKARFTSGYSLEDFEEVFKKAEASAFLKGANSRNWRATFDWLLKDTNMAKVLDGNYDDHDEPQPKGRQSTGNVFLDMLAEEEGNHNEPF